MSEAPVPPIIIDDSGDIGIYQNVELASHEIEAIDVIDGVYDVFDSLGHRLMIVAEGDQVQIGSDPAATSQPEELARRLRCFITRVGPGRIGIDDVETASLQDLIRALVRFMS